MSSPTAGPGPAPARSPVPPRRALREVRQDARELLKALRGSAGASAQAALPAFLAPAPAPYVPYAAPTWPVIAQLQASLAAMSAWLAGFLAPAPAPQPPAPQPPAPPSGRATRFTVSSFNILGGLHTAPGGSAKGYADGVTRARWAAQVVAAKGIEVVGFQEIDNAQVDAFLQASGGAFGIYPGKKLGTWGSQTSIAWKKEDFELVEARHMKMPFLDGMQRETPWVRLRNRHTGQEAWFTNFHNAPSRKTGPDQQRFRDQATDVQVALVRRLERETGLPVIVTGDMNEKANYYRRMTQEAGLHAANQGPRGQAPKQMGIDWIFGSAGVRFSRFVRERAGLVAKVTDHPVLVSEVAIGG